MTKPPKQEMRGAGIVGMALSHGILTALTAKGIFTPAQRDEFLEGVLTGLETKFGADDPDVQSARQLLEGIAGASPPSGNRPAQPGE